MGEEWTTRWNLTNRVDSNWKAPEILSLSVSKTTYKNLVDIGTYSKVNAADFAVYSYHST